MYSFKSISSTLMGMEIRDVMATIVCEKVDFISITDLFLLHFFVIVSKLDSETQ